MINNKYKIFNLIFFTILLVIVLPIIGNATYENNLNNQSILSSNRKGQLNIKLEDFDLKNCNINFSLYHIKEISDFTSMKYSLTEEFKNLTIINVEEYSAELINEIVEYVKTNNIVGKKQEVDNKGNTIFKDLDLGTYIVIMENFEYDETKYQMNPIIINLPQKDGEYDWNYVVTAYPKILKYQGNNVDSLENIEQIQQTNKLPLTGQLTWPIPVFAFLGLIFLILGFALCFMKRDYNE